MPKSMLAAVPPVAPPEETVAVAPPLTSAVPSRAAHYIPTLDGWRALAVSLVIVNHYHFVLQVHPDTGRFTNPGHMGVEFFFTLSGFLITTLLCQERARMGAIDLKAFYLRRAFRILPAALLYLLVVGVLGAIGHIAVSLEGVLGSLFFYRNWLTGDWYTGHFWSLSIEEQFYFFWPLTLVMCRGDRRALRVCLAILALLTGWFILDGKLALLERILPDPPPPFWSRTDRRLDGILWGALLALLLREEKIKAVLRRFVRVEVAFAAFVLVVIGTRNAMLPIVGQTMFRVAVCLMLASTMLHEKSPVSRLFELPPLRWLGRISFSLYLWQELFLWPLVEGHVLRIDPGQHPWVLLSCALACAAASYYWVEQPLIRFGYALRAQKT